MTAIRSKFSLAHFNQTFGCGSYAERGSGMSLFSEVNNNIKTRVALSVLTASHTGF